MDPLIAYGLAFLLLAAMAAATAAMVAAAAAFLPDSESCSRLLVVAAHAVTDLIIAAVSVAVAGITTLTLAFTWPGINPVIAMAVAITVAVAAGLIGGDRLLPVALRVAEWFRHNKRAERLVHTVVPTAVLAVWTILIILIAFAIKISVLKEAIISMAS